jgi:type II secretory pathway component PulK
MKIFKRYNNHSGIALMVVLWVLVLLIALATEFAYSMKGEVNATKNFKEDIEAYHIAKAGINLAMAEILYPASFHALHKDHGLVSGKLISGIKKDNPEINKNPYRIPFRTNIQFGRGTITYTLEDENKKFPINKTSRNILVKVLTLTGVEAGENKDIIADSILDWIDDDTNHRLNGAESEFYQGLIPPYFPKNAPIENLDELIKIRGIDKNILYGTDQHPGLNQFFTVYNVERVNPNTSSLEILSAAFSLPQAKMILKRREKTGFYDDTKSNYFKVTSTGKIEGSPTNHTIVAVMQKILKKNNPIILTHYWNDNSFLNTYNPEQETN